MELIILCISQFVFSYMRTLNVRYTAKEKVIASIISSSFIKVTWLISSFIGINALIKEDYLTGILYVVFGVLGDYFSFKIKVL